METVKRWTLFHSILPIDIYVKFLDIKKLYIYIFSIMNFSSSLPYCVILLLILRMVKMQSSFSLCFFFFIRRIWYLLLFICVVAIQLINLSPCATFYFLINTLHSVQSVASIQTSNIDKKKHFSSNRSFLFLQFYNFCL